MAPFDLEQGKISVRLSEGVYFQLLADVEDFNFKKANGTLNPNAFFNHLLPNLIAYRIAKRKSLRSYIKKSILGYVKDNYKNNFLYRMDDLFDFCYFDDNQEHYHRETIHFRLNKSNIIQLQDFFNELEKLKEKKTTYLRNLFNEYASMRKDKRECICFDDEYAILCHAISKNLSVTCLYKNEKHTIIPVRIDLNYIDGSIYLLALNTENTNICHAFRLCWLRDLKENPSPIHSNIDNELIKKIEYLIYEYDYTDKPNIDLTQITSI